MTPRCLGRLALGLVLSLAACDCENETIAVEERELATASVGPLQVTIRAKRVRFHVGARMKSSGGGRGALPTGIRSAYDEHFVFAPVTVTQDGDAGGAGHLPTDHARSRPRPA